MAQLWHFKDTGESSEDSEYIHVAFYADITFVTQAYSLPSHVTFHFAVKQGKFHIVLAQEQ